MDSQKSLSSPKASESVNQYWNYSSKRKWEVSFDYKTKIYLTNEEKEYFIAQINKGATIVQIGLLTLTPKFQYILPVPKSEAVILSSGTDKDPKNIKPVYEKGKLVNFYENISKQESETEYTPMVEEKWKNLKEEIYKKIDKRMPA